MSKWNPENLGWGLKFLKLQANAPEKTKLGWPKNYAFLGKIFSKFLN